MRSGVVGVAKSAARWLLVGIGVYLLGVVLGLSSARAVEGYRMCLDDPGPGQTCVSGRWERVPILNTAGYFMTIDVGLQTIGANRVYRPADGYSGTAQFYVCPEMIGESTCATSYGWATRTIAPAITSIVSCSPADVTVSPCPTGMAPTTIDPRASNAMNYGGIGVLGGVVIQDVVFAFGLLVCGLLGIGVGTRLL